jgi:Terminase large subunit, ATPase domain
MLVGRSMSALPEYFRHQLVPLSREHREQIFGAPKKSGKTGFAALHMLTMVLLFGGKYAEGYALANDLEQATSRVFQAIKRIVECSPLLRQEAKVTADKITFPAFFGATISTVASDYASAAGANPTISCFDELWAYTSERSRRLFDEMVPPPTRKIACRLTVTFAAHKHYRSAARTGHVPTILLATVSLHGHPNCIIRPLIIADRATLP